MKQNSNTELAKIDLKHKLGYSYNIQCIKQSELFNTLDKLSNFSEDQLTKSDLLDLIKKNCAYMKAHNLFEYYRSEYQKLMFGVNDGDLNNKNSKD